MISLALSHGIFEPQDLAVVQAVYDRVSEEPWFATAPEEQDDFAAYIVRMYARGLVLPDRLEALCRLSARRRYNRHAQFFNLVGRRFLLVEDEYVIAREATERLTDFGATIVGPVGNVSDALRIVEEAEDDFDAALLDISLDGQMVYTVAAFLKMKRVPFAFVTGYEDRQVPLSFRAVPTFSKPADWAAIASSLTGAHIGRTIA